MLSVKYRKFIAPWETAREGSQASASGPAGRLLRAIISRIFLKA